MAERPAERPRGVKALRILKLQPTKCEWCPKIPTDVNPEPANAVELSPKNWAAFQFHLECRATNSWPDDPIVKRNAMLIRQVEDIAARSETDAREARSMSAVISAINAGGKTRG